MRSSSVSKPSPGRRDRLVRHLTIAVLLKLVALFVLWWVFFRAPHPVVDPGQLLLGPPPAASKP